VTNNRNKYSVINYRGHVARGQWSRNRHTRFIGQAQKSARPEKLALLTLISLLNPTKLKNPNWYNRPPVHPVIDHPHLISCGIQKIVL